MYEIIDAIRQVIRDGKAKQEAGKLFTATDDSPASQDFTNGDPETIYSLASLYSQEVDDMSQEEAEGLIIDALTLEFPDYV